MGTLTENNSVGFLQYRATPSPVNALQCRSLIDASIQPDSLPRVYKPQQGVDIVTLPLPSNVWGRFGSFKPARAPRIWALTQKVRTKEVLCLSASLSFCTEFLARGRFLFLIPSPSCSDYRNDISLRRNEGLLWLIKLICSCAKKLFLTRFWVTVQFTTIHRRRRKQQRRRTREQEQTMFNDLRRGFTEDFHGLTEFERTFKDCQRSPKKAPKFKRFCVFGLFDLQKFLCVTNQFRENHPKRFKL